MIGRLTSYGRYLLQLGESHELLILNDLPCFLKSYFFTCQPHGGGVSLVDYVLFNQVLLPFIHHFSVSPITLSDHPLLSFFFQADTPSPSNPNFLAYLKPPFYLMRVILISLLLIFVRCSHLSPCFNQCYKNHFGEKIAEVQKTSFRKNRQNIGNISTNLKKYKNIHF
jgi:hypothetical protein